MVKRLKNRGNKINLVFNEDARREFLTGFRKRKQQRRKEAKEKFENDLKQERKRLKLEAKESYKKLIVSHRPIPEVENLIKDVNHYEDENVSVKISTLYTNNDFIRASREVSLNGLETVHDGDADEPLDSGNEIKGMELRPPQAIKKIHARTVLPKFQTEKAFKKTLKKQNTKNVQKSKILQKKNKLEQMKQKKKSMQKRKEQERLENKRMKGHKKRKSNAKTSYKNKSE